MKKIIIIDDEKSIVNALRRELSDWTGENGLEIIGFTAPLEALEYIRATPEIVLILSDLKMPQILGSDLLLTVNSEFPKIKTILLTGYSEIEEITKSIKAGISAYITKPWNEKHLLSEVQAIYSISLLEEEKEIAEKQLIEELKWGGALQKKLLQRDLPHLEQIKFDVIYQPLPALFCGGDYYDIISLKENRFLILLGDVAGHGLKAAFITTILKSIIFNDYVRPKLDKDISPAEFLKWLNLRIGQELEQFPDILISFSALLIDLNQQHLVYSNAGQSPFFIIRGDKVFQVHRDGICLNISEEASYTNTRIKLHGGDHIFLLSDGLLEISEDRSTLPNEVIEEVFLSSCRDKESLPAIISRFQELSHDKSFHDDVTLLSIRLKE